MPPATPLKLKREEMKKGKLITLKELNVPTVSSETVPTFITIFALIIERFIVIIDLKITQSLL